MRKIFVVEGCTGEWSDRTEWPVAAYFSEVAAQAHVTRAQRRANEILADPSRSSYDIKDGENEHDPKMQVQYTGVQYIYYGVQVMDEITIPL